MTKPQLDAGASRLLAGRYQLLEELASGGMATVWKGHDQVLGRDVAIKLLREELAADAEFAGRFRQEAVHAANLNHPGIVGVFDIGAHDGVPYIVMELVDGRTIRQLIAREGPLPPGQAARIALGVAQALAYAHRLGVTHRNLKPANILLTQSSSVKVADFAIARAVDGEDPERTGEILGPATGYLAPEQLIGGEVDGRADLYALGACLFEMLTGTEPGGAERRGVAAPGGGKALSPRAVRREVPAGLDEIVRTATAARPDDRFTGANDMVAALREQSGRPAPRPAQLPPPPPRQRVTTPLPPPADHTPTPSLRPAATLREPRQPAPGRPLDQAYSPGRSRARWLGPIIAVLVVFTAIAALVGSGALHPNGGAAVGDTKGTTTSGQPRRELPIAAAGTIDPIEQGGENSEDARKAVDGDLTTSWRTQGYFGPGFGGKKAGLGLIVEARGDTPPRELELRLARDGGRAKLFAADKPVGNGQTISPSQTATDLEAGLTQLGWEDVAGEQSLGTKATFELPEDSPSYLLIWITELPRVREREYRLEILEARLFS